MAMWVVEMVVVVMVVVMVLLLLLLLWWHLVLVVIFNISGQERDITESLPGSGILAELHVSIVSRVVREW